MKKESRKTGEVRILNVVSARPNFIKIAALMDAFQQTENILPTLVHTGQHYDEQMSDLFFRQLDIPEPDINLGVGSGSHAAQTAEIMKAFEGVLANLQPDAVLVVGDVNGTIACALVAAKLGVTLIHIEAGLRSFDRKMPEEINRILTDAISDLLFCTEQSAVENLRKEGVDEDKIFLVGNVMIDTLLRHREAAERSTILDDLAVDPIGYAILTLHRPSNVDDPDALRRILDAITSIQYKTPTIFPCHPRTKERLKRVGLLDRFHALPNLRLVDPLGYLDFLKLVSASQIVLTDSGGIQEETTVLNVPCLTLRDNTERPVTTDVGTSTLVGNDTARILAGYNEALNGQRRQSQVPPLWDGRAAERIANLIIGHLLHCEIPAGA